jgi:2-polyprenyl-3-methyl-5-hydroxy-6-metoxy-1,4-benzoquinol methylase
MRSHGWFDLPGQSGDRTIAEQLKGLEPALAEANGKTVADFGCAEGLIAMEFARAGAKVRACDCNVEGIQIAKRLEPSLGVSFEVCNVNVLVELGAMLWRSDIVLALAILHKLRDPVKATRFMAAAAGELLVIRHQGGSKGIVRSKWSEASCDSRAVLEECGMRLEGECQGPRDELVHYWRR